MKRKAITIGRQVQAWLESAKSEVEKAKQDPYLPYAARPMEIQKIADKAINKVVELVTPIRHDIAHAIMEADKAAEKALAVPNDILATRAAILLPVLRNAAERPEVLLRTYEKNYGNLADRQIIEESMGMALDMLETGKDTKANALVLRGQYRDLQARLLPTRAQAEIDADAAVAAAQQVGEYVGMVTEMARLTIAQDVMGLRLKDAEPIQLANVRHAVAMYERGTGV